MNMLAGPTARCSSPWHFSAIAALARVYERERQAGESFPAFVDRVGEKRLAAIAAEAKATAPPA